MKLKELRKNLDDEGSLYTRIISLALLMHVVYLGIFIEFSINTLIVYNIFSVFFYAAMILVTLRKHFRFTVCAVHAEVALFVTVCSMYGGMSMGSGMLLLSMASMLYFCPFKHKRIPYFFAAGEALLYILLRIYNNLFLVNSAALSAGQITFFHCVNACFSFFVIIFATLFTDAENMLARKRLAKENKALKKIANYDDLTGLQSRSFFLSRAEKLTDSPSAAVAIGDIDDFKNINDTYGHLCGDYVLHTIANLFRKALNTEKVDICRWGGEEFVCLFHDDTFDVSYDSLEAFRQRVENHTFEYEGKTFRLTMTFGISAIPSKKFSLQSLNIADRLLYIGKNQGKNRIVK